MMGSFRDECQFLIDGMLPGHTIRARLIQACERIEDAEERWRAALGERDEARAVIARAIGLATGDHDCEIDWDYAEETLANCIQGLRDRAERLGARVATLEAALRAVEWEGLAYFGNDDEAPACPTCGGVKPGHARKTGHSPDCPLAAALAGADNPTGESHDAI